MFPRMRSEGFSCYFGGLGVEMCSLDAAMPSTTIRASDRSEGLVAIPMASAGHFGGLKHRVTSFHVAGVALRDILTCLIKR